MSEWFHGGVPGLQVGDYLVGPDIHGKQATLQQYAGQVKSAWSIRRDRVYLTIDVDAAYLYASVYPLGDLYAAEPEGAVNPDPDCLIPDFSIESERARITRVVQRGCVYRGGI